MDSVNPDPQQIPDEDLTLQNYQDDLDTSGSIKDPIMDELSDDPTKELGVDPKEFKKELDKYAFDDAMKRDDELGDNGDENSEEIEDRREEIEGLDLDDGDTTKY